MIILSLSLSKYYIHPLILIYDSYKRENNFLFLFLV